MTYDEDICVYDLKCQEKIKDLGIDEMRQGEARENQSKWNILEDLFHNNG